MKESKDLKSRHSDVNKETMSVSTASTQSSSSCGNSSASITTTARSSLHVMRSQQGNENGDNDDSDHDDLTNILSQILVAHKDNNHHSYDALLSTDEEVELSILQHQTRHCLHGNHDHPLHDWRRRGGRIDKLCQSAEEKDHKLPPLMEQRLLETGLVYKSDFEFVPDFVSKEVLTIVGDTQVIEELKNYPPKDSYTTTVTHVKTGIWQVLCFDDAANPLPLFYVATAVCMEDRVDIKKLRRALFRTATNAQHKRRPQVVLAPTTVAESMVGYKSGTMAPICHTQPMKLYLEESILQHGKENIGQELWINVGSGVFGMCLSIRADKFLEVARANPKGFQICPLIQTKRKAEATRG